MLSERAPPEPGISHARDQAQRTGARKRAISVLRHKRRRRVLGAVLIVLGAVLMWLAPEATFGALSATGIVLLLAGIALEVVGIGLEHRDRAAGRDRAP